MSGDRVFKILTPAEWLAVQRVGRLEPSDADLRDGFMHLSAAAQVSGTIEAHFAQYAEVVLLELDAGALGDKLKWEPSRAGQLFPHFYGDADLGFVVGVWSLTRDGVGVIQLPAGLE